MSIEKGMWNSLSILRGSLELSKFRNIVLTSLYFRFHSPTKFEAIIEESNENIYSSFIKSLELLSNADSTFIEDLGLKTVSPDGIVFKEVLNQINGFVNKNTDYVELFDTLINLFSRSMGKTAIGIVTPQSVRTLFKSIVGNVKSVIDPACGTGGLLNEFTSMGINIQGQDLNKELVAIARLRFAFNKNVNLFSGDSLGQSKIDRFKADAVVINPPFNLRYEPSNSEKYKYGVPSVRNSNYLWLQLGLNLLNENGRAVVALSNSALFSGGNEAEVRRKMLEDGIVESIISLPSNLLDYTSIPFSIWVLKPNRANKDKILLIDASKLGVMTSRHLRELEEGELNTIGSIYQEFTKTDRVSINTDKDLFRIVDLRELRENNYNLSVSRFFVELLDDSLTDLQELGKIVTPAPKAPSVNEDKIKDLSIRDLSSNIDSFEIDISTLSDNDKRSKVNLISGEALLLARVGEKLKPSFLPKLKENTLINLKNVFAFKVNVNKVRVDYLIQELNKDYVQNQIDSYREGTAIQSIRISDLLTIKISLPSLNEQDEIVAKEKSIRFQLLAKEHGFEKEIALLKEQQRKDLGSKRHNILQHLNNVKASGDILVKMFSKHNGVLRADEIINPKTGVTVERRLQRLQESVDNVLFYVENLTNEIEFEKLEAVHLYEFVRECIEKGYQSDNFEFIDNSDKDTFNDVDPMVLISKRNFEELYNNILYNAVNHGFIDGNKKYIFRYEIRIVDNNVILLFENNGKPFPKGIGVKEKYLVKGEKAGKTGNSGMGGWVIGQIATHFNAELEIFNEPEEEYPVGIQLTFKLTQ